MDRGTLVGYSPCDCKRLRHSLQPKQQVIYLWTSSQFSWTSLVAQTVKRLSTMQETWVRALGWEDPLEKGMATHSSILA